MNPARPIGVSILALFCALVGLLGLFGTGAIFLIGSVKGDLEDWMRPAVVMAVLCVLYFGLAFGLWRLGAWTRWYAPGLLILLAGVALMDFMQSEVLNVASALMFLLAGGANMAVIAWLRQPGVRELFQN